MGKECKKCLKKYDETWGVCLFCGDELHQEEECKEVCSLEETTPEEEVNVQKGVRGLLFIFAMITLVVFILFLAITQGANFYYNVVERFFIK